jgi:hypothetical protein
MGYNPKTTSFGRKKIPGKLLGFLRGILNQKKKFGEFSGFSGCRSARQTYYLRFFGGVFREIKVSV